MFKMTRLNAFNQPVDSEMKDWSAKKKPIHEPIKGQYCVLEPLTADSPVEHLYHSLSLDNDGSSWTYLPYGPFNSLLDFQTWVKETLCNEQDTLLYSITKINEQNPIGMAGFLRINPPHGVIEIGHVHFSQLLQKTPVATEALYLMIHHAFNVLKYRRCEWKCNALNQASINAALRLGFTFEGTFRQCNVFKNQNRDTSWFSILDHEWPNLDERIREWLKPSNFDAIGKQRVALLSVSY
jgi:RimJ/RimL family protein N-acetyltransferase